MNAAGDKKTRESVFKGFSQTKKVNFSYSSSSIMNIRKHEHILDFEHTNVTELNTHCDTCFPLMNEFVPIRGKYVDLLEFSNFNGLPYPVHDESKKPSRWFADLRYCFSTPLPHNYPSVTKEVFNSARVQSTIQQLVSPTTSLASLKLKTKKFFNEIRANFSKFVCKICAYLLYKVFRRLMSKLLVCPDELKRVQAAENTGIPIVYLPLHRSHLDYLLITWCNWHFGNKLPHIASGDNLNLSGLGWLLRATGAFFIRRRVNPDDEGGKDVFYRAVLHSYIEQLLKKDLPIEFFLEGTRNRFGKVLTPKNGLISNVVQAVQQGIIKDCYLVPVSYTYDAVVEGIFLNELMGIPKVRESVVGVFKGVYQGFSKTQQCGIVKMHYGRPVLLSTYISAMTCALSCKQRYPATLTRMPNSFSYRELIPWHRAHSETVDDRSMIRAVGFHVVYEAQMMCSISPIAVFSSVLLSKFRNGVDRHTLEQDCQWLAEQIISTGGDVSGFVDNETTGSPIVEYSLEKLKECVEVVKDGCFVRPIPSHKAFIQLAYNKNSLISRFSIKSAIAISIVSRPARKLQNIQEIVEDALSICDWLQFDFLFCRPCDSLRELVHDILSEDQWADPVHGLLKSDAEDMGFLGSGDESNQSNIVVRDDRSHQILLFFASLIRPFIQSLYMVTVYVSSEKCSEDPISENVLVRELCKDSLDKRLSFPFEPMLESINSDSFKNSIRILKEKGFLSRNDPGKIARSKNAHITEVVQNLERVLRIIH